MARSLNDHMAFDHVVQVHADGTVTDPEWNVYAPELHAISDDDGSHTAETDPDLDRQATEQGWHLQRGNTGQYSYNGPCMHSSEYIGGGLEDRIRATPGLWVAVVIQEDDDTDLSWALLWRPALDCEDREPFGIHSDDRVQVYRGKPYSERWCGFHASTLWTKRTAP